MARSATDIATVILGPLLKINQALLNQVMAEVIEANTEFIEDLNRAQLNAGIDADGREITPDYTAATVAIKNSKGQPTDRVTLHDQGGVYGALFTDVFSNAFVMDDSDPKADDLRAKYGDAIFGLSADSKQKLIDFIKPQFIARLRAAIL